MIVVQKPFPRGAYVYAAAGSRSEPRVCVVEDPSGVTEAAKERGLPRSPAGGCEPLVLGDRPRAVRELIGSQQLPTQRA